MTDRQKQHLLAYLGYYTGQIDGQWGRMSTEACMTFQADYGLTADGICGAMTQKMLIGAISGTAVKVERPAEAEQTETKKPDTGTFWDDIRYFTRAEFKCKCGGQYCDGYPAEMQEAVVKIADAAREHFGRPAHVISGLRCRQWNAHEGGVANSQHMYGEAIDLRIDGVGSETLRQFVSTQPGHRYSYCINSTNVHFDINKVGR